MNILLPVDSSPATQHMLSYMAEHKELLSGDHRLLAFTVIDPAARRPGNLAHCANLEDLFREISRPLLEQARLLGAERGWAVETDYMPGAPAASIVLKAASCKADLIVMGTRARSPIGTMFLGSVASAVLSTCTVPVMLIR